MQFDYEPTPEERAFYERVERYRLKALKWANPYPMILNIGRDEFSTFLPNILRDHNLDGFELRLMLEFASSDSLGTLEFMDLACWGEMNEDIHPELRDHYNLEKVLLGLEAKGYLEILKD